MEHFYLNITELHLAGFLCQAAESKVSVSKLNTYNKQAANVSVDQLIGKSTNCLITTLNKS